MLSPKVKKSFIASMNRYNPYRITSITDSVYHRILNSREVNQDYIIESPRNPKTIYLPPVKIEESSTKVLKNPKPLQHEHNYEPLTREKSKNKLKIDSLQIFSKSLDFSDSKDQSELVYLKKSVKIKPNNQKLLSIRKNSVDVRESALRTMSAMQDREKPFKIPAKFKESKSPWAFQGFKYYKINANFN